MSFLIRVKIPGVARWKRICLNPGFPDSFLIRDIVTGMDDNRFPVGAGNEGSGKPVTRDEIATPPDSIGMARNDMDEYDVIRKTLNAVR